MWTGYRTGLERNAIALTLSLQRAIIKGFSNSKDLDKTAHNEPSHLDLRCLTFTLSNLPINFFASDSLLNQKNRRQTSLNHRYFGDVVHFSYYFRFMVIESKLKIYVKIPSKCQNSEAPKDGEMTHK